MPIRSRERERETHNSTNGCDATIVRYIDGKKEMQERRVDKLMGENSTHKNNARYVHIGIMGSEEKRRSAGVKDASTRSRSGGLSRQMIVRRQLTSAVPNP